jgi:hypothetical protein
MKSRIFDRYDRVAAHDSRYTGEEPSWDDSKTLDGVGYHRRRSSGLSFYNYYCTTKDLINDVAKFAKSQGYKSDVIRIVKSNYKVFSFTASKIARMLNKGMPSTHEGWEEYCEKYPGINMTQANNDIQYVKDEIERVSKQYKEVKENMKSSEPKLSVVDRMNNKVNDKVIYHLDGMIDEWSDASTKVEGLNLTSILKSNDIPVRGLSIVENWLGALRDSLQKCMDKDNEFDIEGWSFLSKPELKNRIKEIDKMLTQIDKYRGANTKVRKPRVKKVKSAEMQVKKLKYKESDDDFGISSVSPINIPGSRKVIFFNTNNRKLFIYESNGESIAVKGTSLQNYDEAKSYGLTIRKPDDILPIITNKSEKVFTKSIDSLTTKQVKCNGRINDQMVILRTL